MAASRDYRPRGIGEILDDAVAVFRANWRVLLVVAGVALLPFAAAYSILASFYLRSFMEAFGSLVRAAETSAVPPPQPDMTTTTLIYPIMYAMGLLYTISRVYFSSTLYAAAGPLVVGTSITPRQMLRAGWRGFFPLVVVEIAVSWISGIAAIVTLPLLGLGGVVVFVLLSMAGPVVVIEGGIARAFTRSASLVRRHFWRVLLLVAGAYLVATQFEAALATPVLLREVIAGVQQPLSIAAPIAWGWKVFDGLLQGFAIAVVYPFLQLVTLLTYLDLRARDEGMDLLIRARSLLAPER